MLGQPQDRRSCGTDLRLSSQSHRLGEEGDLRLDVFGRRDVNHTPSDYGTEARLEFLAAFL
jgi:hypothetical protein